MTVDPHRERTFLLIKPDALHRRRVGQIISRFEDKGFKIVGMKMIWISREQAEKQYACHKGKPFYEPLLAFMTKSPCIAMVVEGLNAIAIARKVMGATNPLESHPGTIRGDMAADTRHNLVHGSDSPESVAHEMPIYFAPQELFEYEMATEGWLYFF